MAVARKLIYQTAEGVGEEDWYYLAHDEETGRTYVIHEWSRKRGDAYSPGSEDLELPDFLLEKGAAQDRLRALIGNLAREAA